MCVMRKAAVEGVEVKPVLEINDFITALSLCGHMKYEEVQQMSLAQRVGGGIANFLGWVPTRPSPLPITQTKVPAYARRVGGVAVPRTSRR